MRAVLVQWEVPRVRSWVRVPRVQQWQTFHLKKICAYYYMLTMEKTNISTNSKAFIYDFFLLTLCEVISHDRFSCEICSHNVRLV